MKRNRISQAIIRRLSKYTFKLVGLDNITRRKITRRNDLQHSGTDYGGWVIPRNLFNSDSICYCVGCGMDISFDLGMIESFGCDIYGFDPTPKAVKYVNDVAGQESKYHFYELGLWDEEDTLRFYTPKNPAHVSHSALNLQKTEEYINVKVKRLSKIMEELGHSNLSLLKIDIEGAEYKVIESIINDGIDIKVICVEYDEYFNPLDKEYKNRIKKSISNLINNDYSLVHSQYNGNYTFIKNI